MPYIVNSLVSTSNSHFKLCSAVILAILANNWFLFLYHSLNLKGATSQSCQHSLGPGYNMLKAAGIHAVLGMQLAGLLTFKNSQSNYYAVSVEVYYDSLSHQGNYRSPCKQIRMQHSKLGCAPLLWGVISVNIPEH